MQKPFSVSQIIRKTSPYVVTSPSSEAEIPAQLANSKEGPALGVWGRILQRELASRGAGVGQKWGDFQASANRH